MKYKSALVTQASGSLKGMTASHNRGGSYLRGRAIPTNPSTAKQSVVRGALRTLVNAWTSVLTALQRSQWKTYADNTPKTDTLGDSLLMTGQQAYIRGNAARIQASLPTIPTGPTTYDFGSFTPPTLTLTASSTTASLVYQGGAAPDTWATEGTSSQMLLYTSPPQNGSKNFYKGPFQFAGKINGTASPATITLPIAAGIAGTKTFFKVTVVRSDGRLSGPFLGSGTA